MGDAELGETTSPVFSDVVMDMDPISVRTRELLMLLHEKQYPTDPESVARTKAFIDENTDPNDDPRMASLRSEVLTSEAGFKVYHNAYHRTLEMNSILASEGLLPPVEL